MYGGCLLCPLYPLLINVIASPKIHVPVKAAIIRLNHSIRVLIYCIDGIQKPLGESPHFVSLNIPI